MHWSHDLACFFGGVFLANASPHFIAGVSGRPMPSPFASPPFKGLSSPPINVLWALVNLAIAYLLIEHLGSFDAHRFSDAGLLFAGFGAMALQCARVFGRIHQASRTRG